MSHTHSEATKSKIRESIAAWRAANPRDTEWRDNRIIELRRAGIKQDAIAAEVGLTQSRVSQLLRAFGSDTAPAVRSEQSERAIP